MPLKELYAWPLVAHIKCNHFFAAMKNNNHIITSKLELWVFVCLLGWVSMFFSLVLRYIWYWKGEYEVQSVNLEQAKQYHADYVCLAQKNMRYWKIVYTKGRSKATEICFYSHSIPISKRNDLAKMHLEFEPFELHLGLYSAFFLTIECFWKPASFPDIRLNTSIRWCFPEDAALTVK